MSRRPWYAAIGLLAGCRAAEPEPPLVDLPAKAPMSRGAEPRSVDSDAGQIDQIVVLDAGAGDAAPPPNSAVDGPAPVDVLIDCNPVMDPFGLACPEPESVDGKRVMRSCFIKKDTGLAQVNAALQQALNGLALQTEANICGFGWAEGAPRLRCDRTLDQACDGFRRGRKEVSLGWAASALRAQQAGDRRTSVVLTHGAASIGKAQLDDTLKGLDVFRLGREVGEGATTFAGLHLSGVPVRRTRYRPTGDSIPKEQGGRHGALGILLWGPNQPVTHRLIDRIVTTTRPFAPVVVPVSAAGWGEHAPLIEGVSAAFTQPKGSALVPCQPAGDDWSCKVAWPLTTPGRHAQREVLVIRVPYVMAEGILEAVQIELTADGKSPSDAFRVVEPGVELQALRLEQLRPVDSCAIAKAALDRRLPAIGHTPAGFALVVPVQCLAIKGDQPKALSIQVALIGRPPTPDETFAAWARTLDAGGLPETDVAMPGAVLGFRQIMTAVHTSAMEHAWAPDRLKVVHHVEVAR